MTTDNVTAPIRRATFRDVLAVREYRAIYVAQTLSVAGDQLARIAVAVLVFTRTHSALLTGLSYAVTYLPWIVGGPLLSVSADRLPRRRVMIVCDLLRTALVLVLAIPGEPTAVLMALVTLVALFEPPFSAARAAMVPDIVGDGDLYTSASTLGNTTNQLAVVAGFAVGGALVALLGARPTLVADAVTFGLSALIAARYVKHRPAAATSPDASRTAAITEAARTVFRDPRLRWLVLTSWILVGTVITTEAVAVPYAQHHNEGPLAAGLLSAAVPLGVVLGALLMGRRPVHLEHAERSLLPAALLTPLVLALSAFDPDPAVVFAIWFIAGVTSAVTLVANRLFVVAIPNEMRGRAFGIAAAGISGAQGLGTLLVGLLAAHVGSARAIADIALPAFALVVAVSSISRTYRDKTEAPISGLTEAEDEELAMPAQQRPSNAGVWALNIVLAVTALAIAPLFHGGHPYADIHLEWWWVLALFALGYGYPLKFQYRQQNWDIYLETVPLVIGLLFLSPITLLVLRTCAVAANYFLARQQPIRSAFNTASCACHTVAAIGVFKLLVPSHDAAHPKVWPALFAAVLTSEAVSWLLVSLVVGFTDRSWELRERLRSGAVGTAVAVVLAFLAIAMAASLAYDAQSAWAITVFVVLSIIGLQTYHRLAERAAALDRLYVVARELGPTTSSPADLAPALAQLRRILKAQSLELTTPSTDQQFVSVVTVRDDAITGESTSVEERPLRDDIALALAGHAAPTTRKMPIARRRRNRSAEQQRLSALVRTDDRVLGLLTASNASGGARVFERSDLRVLEAAADQLAAALEKGRLIESLRRAATLDKLTGLANLESLRSFLDTTLEGSAGGMVMLLNLDRFREVNDMLGHGAGDAVLEEVARRLQSAPAQGALLARVGGDQFAIAIPGAAGSEVAHLAAMAVKSRLDGSVRLAEVSADIRMTIGIARAPDHGSDSATLLRRAEMAMAVAKGSSSGIGEWEPDYERDGSRRLELLTGLRAALSDGSLRVEYQPKLRLGSGEVTGFEALVRWTHPTLGPVSPAEFVPLAEATGLISALTSTVLRQALTACRSWHDAGQPVGVAVNVSARSLDDNVLVGQVAAMLTASGLEPRWLTLEITESSVMEDHAHSIAVLRELRMLGVRLSIDDFGTGYSSLHQLRGLPVHEVKIDRSFVDTVDCDEADRAVVRAVVELCESLDLTTVAEGVEKASQAFALESLGVEQVQGYFFGRPMPETSALDWVLPRRTVPLAVSDN